MRFAVGAQLPAHGVAVESRQQDVEDDRRVDALGRPPEAVRTGVRDVDVEALGAQAAGDGLGEAWLVVDDQHAHDGQSDRAATANGTRSQRTLSRTHRTLNQRSPR